MLIASLVTTLALGALDPMPSRCSVGALRNNPEGYMWPLENIRGFVGEAELIVRAKATALGPELALPLVAATLETSVQFEVLEVLKGDSSPLQLSVPGETIARDDFNRGAIPYRMVRSGGQMGNCIATAYKLGAEYLLLLQSRNKILNPYWAPLAPLNEQITGRDDAWVMWVREQLK